MRDCECQTVSPRCLQLMEHVHSTFRVLLSLCTSAFTIRLNKSTFLMSVKIWLLALRYYSAPIGEQSIAISLSVCVSVCPRACLWKRWTDLHDFLCRSPVAVARSSSGGVAICYILPVLSMTSRLAVLGRTTGVATGRLMSMNALLKYVNIFQSENFSSRQLK